MIESDYILDWQASGFYESFAMNLKKHGFCIIKNFFSTDKIQKKVEILKNKFNTESDIRISGPNIYKMNNYQRLDVGDYSQVNARFSRVFTEFTWNEGIFTEEIQELINFRNKYLSLTCENYIYEHNGKHLCDLPKIIHYPIGGGFINEHYDSYNNDGIMNILISLTKRGTDFENGGVYYKDMKGDFIDVDDMSEVGYVYMHLPTTIHGVKAIDAHKKIDLNSLNGRMAINLSCESFDRIK